MDLTPVSNAFPWKPYHDGASADRAFDSRIGALAVSHFQKRQIDYFEYDADQPYVTSVPSGRPVNNIGQQWSPAKEGQNRQLDQRMYQFLELRKVE